MRAAYVAIIWVKIHTNHWCDDARGIRDYDMSKNARKSLVIRCVQNTWLRFNNLNITDTSRGLGNWYVNSSLLFVFLNFSEVGPNLFTGSQYENKSPNLLISFHKGWIRCAHVVIRDIVHVVHVSVDSRFASHDVQHLKRNIKWWLLTCYPFEKSVAK